MHVPFNRPYITGNEIKYMEDILKNGKVFSGDGEYTRKVSRLMESKFGAKKVLLTTSCTSALEMSTFLLKLKPGDEVILPSYTFVSTANPILIAGARPVFAEVDESTLNLDPEDVTRKITSRTKAIYPVHYAGVSCDMGAFSDIAKDNGLAIVEDAAQGVNARYKDQYLGTIGDFGCYSFHESKNYVCGEGGAILVNSDDRKINERAEILREKGTNRSKFFRGEIDKYTWVDMGSSYLPSDLLAAFLYAQLEQMDSIQESRMRVYNAYRAALKPFEDEGIIRLPKVPSYATHNAHMFFILFRDGETRDSVMASLKSKGVHAIFHYIPLHSSRMGLSLGYKAEDLPITESVSSRILRLPLFAGMTDDELGHVIKTVTAEISRTVHR